MNKKGSAIVEAALVFPVMILCIVAVLWILIYFFDQLEAKVDTHIMLRKEAGELCGNYYYVNNDEEGVYYRNAKGIYAYATASLDNKGVLKGRSKTVKAEKYLIDEVRTVRLVDIVESGPEDE